MGSNILMNPMDMVNDLMPFKANFEQVK